MNKSSSHSIVEGGEGAVWVPILLQVSMLSPYCVSSESGRHRKPGTSFSSPLRHVQS
jgi:hypothetical protein